MIRTPLRPLARILRARERGENPDEIEAENRRLRHERMQDRARSRSAVRVVLMAGCFVMAFGTVGLRMGMLASTEPSEPRSQVPGAQIMSQRADITDRQGRV